MDSEIDHLIEYFSLLQVMATTGKTHAAIIHSLYILANGVNFREGQREAFMVSLGAAMEESQATLQEIAKAEARINKRHRVTLSGLDKPKNH